MTSEQRFLVITEATKESGLGNYKRSSNISKELSIFADVHLVVITNQLNINMEKVSDSYVLERIESIQDIFEFTGNYSHVLIDVTNQNLNTFINRVKKIDSNTKVVALDYFFECEFLDLQISLFDHVTKRFSSTKPKHLVGLEYAVVDEIENMPKKRESLPVITIRFSGENPDFMGKTVNALNSHFKTGSIQIRTINNSGESGIALKSMPRPEFLKIISNSDLVICSGVTTLLECSLLKVPTIFIGSNSLETRFGEHLSREKGITFLNGFANDFESSLLTLVKAIDLQAVNNGMIPKLDLDFEGKHRIIEAILSL